MFQSGNIIDILLDPAVFPYIIGGIILLVIAIILGAIIILSVVIPHKFIELNWIICVVVGIVMIIYISTIGGVLILIAGFVGYTER